MPVDDRTPAKTRGNLFRRYRIVRVYAVILLQIWHMSYSNQLFWNNKDLKLAKTLSCEEKGIDLS